MNADHKFEKFDESDTWCKHCNCPERGGEIEHLTPITDYRLSWNDIADIYKQTTGGTARIRPMDEIAKWAEGRTDLFRVDEKGYFYRIKTKELRPA